MCCPVRWSDSDLTVGSHGQALCWQYAAWCWCRYRTSSLYGTWSLLVTWSSSWQRMCSSLARQTLSSQSEYRILMLNVKLKTNKQKWEIHLKFWCLYWIFDLMTKMYVSFMYYSHLHQNVCCNSLNIDVDTINMFDRNILRFSTARVTHNLTVIYYGAAL